MQNHCPTDQTRNHQFWTLRSFVQLAIVNEVERLRSVSLGGGVTSSEPFHRRQARARGPYRYYNRSGLKQEMQLMHRCDTCKIGVERFQVPQDSLLEQLVLSDRPGSSSASPMLAD